MLWSRAVLNQALTDSSLLDVNHNNWYEACKLLVASHALYMFPKGDHFHQGLGNFMLPLLISNLFGNFNNTLCVLNAWNALEKGLKRKQLSCFLFVDMVNVSTIFCSFKTVLENQSLVGRELFHALRPFYVTSKTINEKSIQLVRKFAIRGLNRQAVRSAPCQAPANTYEIYSVIFRAVLLPMMSLTHILPRIHFL